MDKLPKSDKAGRPWLRAGLGPARGSEGGAKGVVPSMPTMKSSGAGASRSSSGGAPVTGPASQSLLVLPRQAVQSEMHDITQTWLATLVLAWVGRTPS